MKWQDSHSLAGHTLASSALSRSQGPGCCQWSDTREAWNLMWAHRSGVPMSPTPDIHYFQSELGSHVQRVGF